MADGERTLVEQVGLAVSAVRTAADKLDSSLVGAASRQGVKGAARRVD